MGGEDELGSVRVRLPILEQPQQAGGQPRVKAGVDLVEQEDAAAPKSTERRPDESEPCLGSDRLLGEVEGDLLLDDAMQEPQLTPRRCRYASVLVFDHLHIVDPKIREAQQGQGRISGTGRCEIGIVKERILNR